MRLVEIRFGSQQVRSMNRRKKGKVIFMVRGLYELKIFEAACRTFFAKTLSYLIFFPTVADTDIYHRQVRNPNGEEYYELLLVNADDVLCCFGKPKIDNICTGFGV